MKFYRVAALSLVLLWLGAQICHGDVLFSTLPRTLVILASPNEGQVLKAGEDTITVTWGLNHSLTDRTYGSYNKVMVKLCYAPISQVDRGWRKTVDNLNKDKTCQFTIVQKTFEKNNQTYKWSIERDVPTAVYFVRVYAYNSAGNEVAYGQTTDSKKSTNLFEVQAITGSNLSLDIASICFSAFAVLSAVGFFLIEKSTQRSAKK